MNKFHFYEIIAFLNIRGFNIIITSNTIIENTYSFVINYLTTDFHCYKSMAFNQNICKNYFPSLFDFGSVLFASFSIFLNILGNKLSLKPANAAIVYIRYILLDALFFKTLKIISDSIKK